MAKYKHQKDVKFTANGETSSFNAEAIRQHKDGTPKTEAEFVQSVKDNAVLKLTEAQAKEIYALAHLPEEPAKDEVAKEPKVKPAKDEVAKEDPKK